MDRKRTMACKTQLGIPHVAHATSVRVTWSNRTKGLVRFPFIARWGANRFRYQALFRAYARKHFAFVPDSESIARRLVQAAQS